MLRQQKTNQFAGTILVYVVLFVFLLAGCAQQDNKSSEPSTKQETETTKPETTIKPVPDSVKPEPAIAPENAIAVIETAKGNIEFEFFATDAPQTSKNFIKNASRGYYQNTSFRVEELIIQAGTDFAYETLPIEKSDHPLEKGVVLMAKKEGATVSDGDEFFICKDAIALDEDHTTLGKVIKGLDILDTIEAGEKIVNITIRERAAE